MPECPTCGSHNLVALCVNCERTMQLTDPTEYNGWANYPTWRVISHFDNTDDRDYWQDQAVEFYYGARATETAKVASNQARVKLADSMKDEWLESWCEGVEVGTPAYDLLAFAIRMIDFHDVADVVLALYVSEYVPVKPTRRASR